MHTRCKLIIRQVDCAFYYAASTYSIRVRGVCENSASGKSILGDRSREAYLRDVGQ